MNGAKSPTIAVLCVILGLPGNVLGTVYDFSTGAGVDHFAYGNSIPDAAIPPAINNVPSATFGPTDYAAVGASDDSRYTTGVIEGGIVAATRFTFTIAEPPATVTRLDVLWEGGSNQGEFQSVWLWNATTGSYTLVGSQSAAVPPDGTIAGSYGANAADFIDGANVVTVLVTYSVQGGALLTDYVSVTITGPECAVDADCDDGLACNGAETCVGALLCQAGTPVDCNDGVPCTVDACIDPAGSCENLPNDALCDNGAFCDGIEACDAVSGCLPGLPVDCDDGIDCTTDSCNEGANACDHIPDAPGCLTPSIWYVDADAVGANDGTSWADAFNALQDALAATGYGDEIWVAAGIYKADEGAGQTPGDMAATFWLRNGVAVYGHFLGTETTFAQRTVADLADPLRQTVLGGDIGIIGIAADNTNNVVTISGVDDTTLLDGFTVRDGIAFGVLGGRGGGLTIGSGSPTLNNCTFTANSAGALGGGVYNLNGTPTLIHCTFDGNSADFGGGMLNHFGSSVLINCTFTANQADERGGGMYELFGNSTLTGCTFNDNFTVAFNSMGGGMYVHQFGAAFGTANLTNCLFSGNSSNHGGGMMALGVATLTHCTFSGNSATLDSGGLSGVFVAPSLTHCILWGNTGVGTLERQQLLVVPGVVDYSCVEGWTGALGGVGNIGADPLFADPVGGDYRLTAGSLSIDAGDPTLFFTPGETDLDGHPRVLCGRVDLGAYEFGIGDFNCDRTVDLLDFSQWDACMTGPDGGPYGPGCEAFDFEADGDADFADFAGFGRVLTGL